MSGCPILLIDAGNTYIKWQLTVQSKLLKSGRLNSIDLNSLFEGDLEDLSGCDVAISSVLEDSKTMLIGSFAKARGARSVFVAETKREFLGLTVAYENHRMLGVDRWLVMLASFVRYGGVCVIDAGSAITVDFVNRQGEHDGGFILPGLPLLYKSLSISTDKVGAHQMLTSLDVKLGESTKECVDNGIALMVSGSFKEIEILNQKMGGRQIVLTGGDASLMTNCFGAPESVVVNRSLVFDGLVVAMDNGGLKEIQ